jgi:hypothetical protein
VDLETAIRVVAIGIGVFGVTFDVGWFSMLVHVRRKDGLGWQRTAIGISKGAVGLLTSAVIIAVGAGGSYARVLTYVLALAVFGNLVLVVWLRRSYPELLDVD